MKFNIAICDDEINIASSLKNKVEQFFEGNEHFVSVFDQNGKYHELWNAQAQYYTN